MADSGRGHRMVAGDHTHLDAGAVAFGNGGFGFGARWIDDADHRHEAEVRHEVEEPGLRIEGGRVIILDLQFLTDLVTTGVYWLLFDSLPKRSRETFKELWGRCFEIYVTELLRHFYPLTSQILSTDIAIPNGQIDALLDFGPDVFVVEIKSSLLTEAAKRSGDATALAADIERKFIRNERGAPKAVVQLARAADTYAHRRQSLLHALATRDLQVRAPAGMNVWIPVRHETAVVEKLAACGWSVAAGERFRLRSGPGIRVTTSALAPDDAQHFAADLVAALRTGAPVLA
jgi:hypothetical protein